MTTAELLRNLPHRSERSLQRIALLASRMLAERRTKRQLEQGCRIHAAMRIRTRWYCDYCEKGFWTRSSAEKHNHSCTLNPLRICGFCINCRIDQKPLTTLRAVLSQTKLDRGVAELRELAKGCPACMYAALRQSDVSWLGHFEFKAEREEFRKLQKVECALDGETSFEHHILRKKHFEQAMEAAIKLRRGKAA
jgi:hypothetical protein